MDKNYIYIKKILHSLDKTVSENEIYKSENGYNSEVYIIKSEKIVIKLISKSEKSAEKETKIIEFLSKQIPEFPIPKVIKYDSSKKIIPFTYIVLSLIKGEPLNEIYEKIPNKHAFFEQLGELKGELNSLKNNVFGNIDSNLEIEKKYDSWNSFIQFEVNHSINKLKDQEFKKEFINKLQKYWENNNFLLDSEIGPCFSHGDTSKSNILVNYDFRISGIIDFEYAKWGGGLHDLFSSIKGFKIFYKYVNDILKGYSKYHVIPKEWNKLIWFYQWCAHVKQLSNIQKMKWRNLTPEEESNRKQLIFDKSMQMLQTIENELR